MNDVSASLSNVSSIGRNPRSGNRDTPKEVFKTRISNEVVLGFAGPVGCGISSVIKQTVLGLEAFGYKIHHIKLSKFIETALSQKVIHPRSEEVNPNRYLRLQDGGNELRKNFGNDILAEYSIKEIVRLRGQHMEEELANTPKVFVPQKIAYLIDQIKHPDEVLLLRSVYRKLFHLIGVVSIHSKRQARLEHMEHIDKGLAIKIMERDRLQEEDNGQQLDKSLQMADFFVRSDRGTIEALKNQMDRFLELLHGKNGLTPTKQEYGMYVAYAAKLRSACMSRQVGAAIVDRNGDVISTGCNDVPKSGGGLYSTEDGINDKRCVHHEEQICFNDREKELLKNRIRNSLQVAVKKGTKERLIDEGDIEDLLRDVYDASRIKHLIEFSRAVHAEMDAIISLARTGTSGIKGTTLYTTTFPCHSCARHIVAAGIRKIYYIEPYEKSLAQNLHSDAIAFDTEDEDVYIVEQSAIPSASMSTKFIHFEGVAPSQYLNFFKMGNRKDDVGNAIKIAGINSQKTVNEYLDDYRDFESKVLNHLSNVLPNVMSSS